MGDIEVMALVGAKLAELTGDQRFTDYWKFVLDGRTDVYLQRILDGSTQHARATSSPTCTRRPKEGIPALMNSRTYPQGGRLRAASRRQALVHARRGRLEFYRQEHEFIEAGETLPVHREPVDSTFYEPNAIVAPDAPVDSRRAGPRTTASSATTCRARRARSATSCRPGPRAKQTAAPADEGRLPVHLPDAEVPLRRALDADRHRHDRDAVRPVRRPVPARHAQPVRTEAYVEINPTDAQGARRRGRRLRLDRRRPGGPAVPRLEGRTSRTTTSRG